jgi:LysM repeat protein
VPLSMRYVLSAIIVAIILAVGFYFYFPLESSEENIPDTASEQATEKANIDSAAISDAPEITYILPEFDIARLDEDNNLLIAGTGEKNVTIKLFANGQFFGEVLSDSNGKWVFVSDDRLDAGSYKITLSQILPDGTIIDGLQNILITVNDDGGAGDNLIVLQDPNILGSKILQEKKPIKKEPIQEYMLRLQTVDYDENGRSIFQGTASGGDLTDASVRLFIQDVFLGETSIGDDGMWKIIPKDNIDPGTHQLTIILYKNGDEVKTITLPFTREDIQNNTALKQAIEKSETRIVVQPGNSLWRIARRELGSGFLYTVIYKQNKNIIKNPDLIYPGQILMLQK